MNTNGQILRKNKSYSPTCLNSKTMLESISLEYQQTSDYLSYPLSWLGFKHLPVKSGSEKASFLHVL